MLDPQSTATRQELLLSSFNRGADWATERCEHLCPASHSQEIAALGFELPGLMPGVKPLTKPAAWTSELVWSFSSCLFKGETALRPLSFYSWGPCLFILGASWPPNQGAERPLYLTSFVAYFNFNNITVLGLYMKDAKSRSCLGIKLLSLKFCLPFCQMTITCLL